MFTPVTVIRDGAVRAAGHRHGAAIVYDWGFTWEGAAREQRSFVLLDTGFQINQPVVFPEQQRGWWYCNRRHDIRRDTWPDFPPRAVAALAELPFRPRWEALAP
ncbi:hypothetical protein [Dactylosporangium sp. NPDC049140]|uniref:hypothetical protein n=1 Tax=Dactylosporangium sp. NPDC049140 TaxID=3155647 RepID=UPI003403D9C4